MGKAATKPTESVLQEIVDNRGISLKIDREAGVIHGVKVLGVTSKNGREYPKKVIQKAATLYEGKAVNVDHIDPKSRRSYRDRIGAIKDVQLHEDGLYGDFHFNPKHELAEQLIWDAEHAPENVGFSHDARGPSKRQNGKEVVESIDKVLSVDLVANPATTNGLFESVLPEGEIADQLAQDERKEQLRKINCTAMDLISGAMYGDEEYPTIQSKKSKILSVLADWESELTSLPSASGSQEESMDYKEMTLDDLKKNRPDLVGALQESLEATNGQKSLQEEVVALRAEKATRELKEAIDGELKAAKLDTADKAICSEVFLESLLREPDSSKRKALIEDRSSATRGRSMATNPQSASPFGSANTSATAVPKGKEFARAIR
jgi:hypothetical protein